MKPWGVYGSSGGEGAAPGLSGSTGGGGSAGSKTKPVLPYTVFERSFCDWAKEVDRLVRQRKDYNTLQLQATSKYCERVGV